MAKISVYPTISSPLGDDILIGTDIHHQDATKNFMISDMFAIGLETSVTKLKIYDPTLFGYGEVSLDNDVFRVKGAPTNTRNLLVSSATGYLSFKKNNYDVKLDATAITDSRTYTLPNIDGHVALVETTNLQTVTTQGNITTNDIKVNELYLYDAANDAYGKIKNTDSSFSAYDMNGDAIFEASRIDNLFSFGNSNGIPGIFNYSNLTATRTYVLPDKSGTFALTSDLRPYKVFTALLTQSGVDTEDTISSGLLTIGVTYHINTDSPGMDFTNVGAPNNNLGTAFIATGTTPASWGSGGSLTLAYSAGAPVATVLENTIGDVTWSWINDGYYNTNESFDVTKTTVSVSNNTGQTYSYVPISSWVNGQITIFTSDSNGILNNTFIEIRVYNA